MLLSLVVLLRVVLVSLCSTLLEKGEFFVDGGFSSDLGVVWCC